MTGPDSDPFRGSAGELITEPITTMDQAFEQIVVDARNRVVDLDWQQVGISTEDAATLFDGTYAFVLRQAPYEVALTCFKDTEQDVESIPRHYRKPSAESYWLAMTRTAIDPEFATFTRDHLLIKIPEVIAVLRAGQLPPYAVLTQVSGDMTQFEGPISRAAARMVSYLDAHPEIARPDESQP